MTRERQDSTLPQFRCGICGDAISTHTAPGYDHSWTPAKEHEEFWSQRNAGISPGKEDPKEAQD